MKRTIIRTAHTDGKRNTSAFVFGDWAAHERPTRDGGYEANRFTVSHVPTGLAIDTLFAAMQKSDALAIARRLGDRVPGLPLNEAQIAGSEWRHIVMATVAEALDGECP